MLIKKATVLGAGNMGSQIAALLVNAGLKVQLLDIVIDEADPNKLSRAAYERITDRKKGLLYRADFAGNLTFGNFNDDLNSPNDSDLFIEAVSEDIQIKHNLWLKVQGVAKPQAILTSNTSGIPIADVASVLEPGRQAHFAGLHFFNPPRFMKLVEVIPHSGTNSEILIALCDFASRTLGKGVVETNDVPGFVANRIGVYALVDVMYRGEQAGLTVEQIDALTGPVIGRPKTATYRLMDMVGIDIAYHVAKNMSQVAGQENFYKLPTSMETLINQGYLGNKTKQGYYKKEGKAIFAYDLPKNQYADSQGVELPFLAQLGRNVVKNLKVIFEQQNDPHAKFLWDSIANILYYSAVNVPEATQNFKNIDRALVWGYNWKLGPFQIWDAIGFDNVKAKLRDTFGQLPQWIEERTENFYAQGESISQVAQLPSFVAENVWHHAGVSELNVTENQILILTLRSPNNTFTYDFALDLQQAVKLLNEQNYRAMVIHAEGANFSLGANVGDMAALIEAGKVETEIAALVDAVQGATHAVKYASKPIVTATQGRALGGGAEILLHSPFVVAAAESYIGLVEIGVGVIPSGGGLSILAERVYRQKLERAEEIAQLNKAFKTVIFAQTSANAYDAQAMGLLRTTDTIIQNEELVLEAALKKADFEAAYNYQSPCAFSLPVEGSNYRAQAQAQLASLVSGGFATEYEKVIGTEVATVLSGGDIPLGTQVSRQHLLQLEKQGFLKLCSRPKTLERMQHMLKTKRVLRN